jgi:hypothetical protein
MANKFQRFLGDMAVGFLNPKGNMADYQHAARLYTDDTFRLAPKHKFLYYVVFNINPDALDNVGFKDRHKLELNYLVKSVDLPKYTLKTETLNQYNRKTSIYTAIQYEPVSLTLHDDNNGITNMLWALYYGYYIADRSNAANPDADTFPTAYMRNAYYPKSKMPYRYGLDNGSDEPFFDSIQLFTLSRQRFFSYMLCNPKITKWDHDSVDQSDGRGILENKMTLAYDAVIYNSGVVQPDDPSGFAVLHYDNTPSPIVSAEILQNGMAGIFGDVFSINALNSSAGGLLGGLVGGLINGITGGISPYTNTGNQIPYGYGQPTFLNQGIGLGNSGGLQQYGFGGVTPLTALTIAGVGLAAKGLGNIISGVGSLFSNSNGSTTPSDLSKSVESPNGQSPAASDTFVNPVTVANSDKFVAAQNGIVEQQFVNPVTVANSDKFVAAQNGIVEQQFVDPVSSPNSDRFIAAQNGIEDKEFVNPVSTPGTDKYNQALNGTPEGEFVNPVSIPGTDQYNAALNGIDETQPSAGEVQGPPMPPENNDVQLEPIGVGYDGF